MIYPPTVIGVTVVSEFIGHRVQRRFVFFAPATGCFKEATV